VRSRRAASPPRSIDRNPLHGMQGIPIKNPPRSTKHWTDAHWIDATLNRRNNESTKHWIDETLNRRENPCMECKGINATRAARNETESADIKWTQRTTHERIRSKMQAMICKNESNYGKTLKRMWTWVVKIYKRSARSKPKLKDWKRKVCKEKRKYIPEVQGSRKR